MWTSPTRSRARWPPARARCWWSTPPRASRRRASPTATRRIEQGLEVLPVLNKIDLPSADPDKVIKRDRGDHRHRCAEDALRVWPRPARTSPDLLEALVRAHPAAEGRPGGAAAGADHRLLVRQLRRRRVAGAGHERRDASRATRSGDVHRPQPPDRQARRLHAEDGAAAELLGGRGRLRDRRHQGDRRRAGRRHHHARAAAGARRRCRASSRCSRGCSPASSRSTPTTTRTSAMRSPSCSSTTPRCTTSRRCPRRWASASAAASSACCTWRSSRSGWSASTTST